MKLAPQTSPLTTAVLTAAPVAPRNTTNRLILTATKSATELATATTTPSKFSEMTSPAALVVALEIGRDDTAITVLPTSTKAPTAQPAPSVTTNQVILSATKPARESTTATEFNRRMSLETTAQHANVLAPTTGLAQHAIIALQTSSAPSLPTARIAPLDSKILLCVLAHAPRSRTALDTHTPFLERKRRAANAIATRNGTVSDANFVPTTPINRRILPTCQLPSDAIDANLVTADTTKLVDVDFFAMLRAATTTPPTPTLATGLIANAHARIAGRESIATNVLSDSINKLATSVRRVMVDQSSIRSLTLVVRTATPPTASTTAFRHFRPEHAMKDASATAEISGRSKCLPSS